MGIQVVKHIRSSTWGNNAKRGKCDPWTYFFHKMRCLIKPTSIWVHRADRGGGYRGLRRVKSRLSSHCKDGSRSWAWLRGAGWDTFWMVPAISPQCQAARQAVINPGPISCPLRCDTPLGKGDPVPAFPPAWGPSLHLQDQVRGYEVVGCFIIMIILKKLTY